MLPLIVRPALLELTGAAPGSPRVSDVGRAAVLHPGVRRRHLRPARRLPDRPARPPARADLQHPDLRASRRSLSGFSTSIEMLLVLRCFVFIGVCVEFVAAVAWLAELFPEPKRREKVLGYTQAFSSLGGLLVATANGLCVAYAASLPAHRRFGVESIQNPHAPWRYTLMSGVHPGDSADPHPAVPARVAAGSRRRRPARSSGRASRRCSRRSSAARRSSRRSCSRGVRRGVRRDPADPADRSRAARSAADDAGTAAAAGARSIDAGSRVERHQGPGDRRPGRPRRCSRTSPSSSSAAAS